jgi:hypothetical protein
MNFTSNLACGGLLALSSILAVGCGTSTTLTGTDTGSPGVDSGANDGGGVDGATLPDTGADTGADAGVRVPMYHRPDDSACSAAAPAGNCSFGGGGPGVCSMDSECTAGVNGRCNMNNGGAVFCRCTYDTCQHDTDCPTGQACACHGADFHADSNECIAGNCRVDSDCGAAGFCSPTIGGCGGLAGYYCHTASDTCIDDSDCTGGALQACQYVSTSSRWQCMDRLLCG